MTRSVRTEEPVEPMPWGKISRIVGGSETSEGSYPWTASVRLKETNQHYCGASLIDKFHVLTAAHCFDKDNNTNSYWVILGEWDVSRDEPQEMKFELAEIIPHPDYKGLKSDDVALVRLKTSDFGVPFTDYIQPVCLSTKYSAVGRNTKCYVSGWGSNGETVVNRMQAAQIPVISRSQCTQNDVYGSSLSLRTFCAGYLTGGVDACIGDSGGPFACEVNSMYKTFELDFC
uniref:Peptidase S1 domain-containing protein n=1 Tax=Romanomermis culicivorax TaxID=13658 RepID=A0A915IS77_ROMCU